MYRGFFKVKLIFLIGSKKLVQIIGKFLISLVFLLICLLFDVLNQKGRRCTCRLSQDLLDSLEKDETGKLKLTMKYPHFFPVTRNILGPPHPLKDNIITLENSVTN